MVLIVRTTPRTVAQAACYLGGLDLSASSTSHTIVPILALLLSVGPLLLGGLADVTHSLSREQMKVAQFWIPLFFQSFFSSHCCLEMAQNLDKHEMTSSPGYGQNNAKVVGILGSERVGRFSSFKIAPSPATSQSSLANAADSQKGLFSIMTDFGAQKKYMSAERLAQLPTRRRAYQSHNYEDIPVTEMRFDDEPLPPPPPPVVQKEKKKYKSRKRKQPAPATGGKVPEQLDSNSGDQASLPATSEHPDKRKKTSPHDGNKSCKRISGFTSFSVTPSSVTLESSQANADKAQEGLISFETRPGAQEECPKDMAEPPNTRQESSSQKPTDIPITETRIGDDPQQRPRTAGVPKQVELSVGAPPKYQLVPQVSMKAAQRKEEETPPH